MTMTKMLTDYELWKIAQLEPPVTAGMTQEQKLAAETAEVARLESMDRTDMSSQVRLWHSTAIRDAYWRRRMASRTEEQVKAGVVAP